MAIVETTTGVLGTALVGIGAWVIQLGTRVSVTESRYLDLVTLINSRFDEQGRRLDSIERAMNREED